MRTTIIKLLFSSLLDEIIAHIHTVIHGKATIRCYCRSLQLARKPQQQNINIRKRIKTKRMKTKKKAKIILLELDWPRFDLLCCNAIDRVSDRHCLCFVLKQNRIYRNMIYIWVCIKQDCILKWIVRSRNRKSSSRCVLFLPWNRRCWCAFFPYIFHYWCFFFVFRWFARLKILKTTITSKNKAKERLRQAKNELGQWCAQWWSYFSRCHLLCFTAKYVYSFNCSQ